MNRPKRIRTEPTIKPRIFNYKRGQCKDSEYSLNLSTTFVSMPQGQLEGRKNFPEQLYNMLSSEIEKNGLEQIASWQPHGRCFRVHDVKAFVDKIMPVYFRQTKWSSFQRQLHLYGFTRLAGKGPDRNGYYHEKFLRGKPSLLCNITRTTLKGTRVRLPCDVEKEPNFYKMPPIVEDETRSKTNNLPLLKSATSNSFDMDDCLFDKLLNICDLEDNTSSCSSAPKKQLLKANTGVSSSRQQPSFDSDKDEFGFITRDIFWPQDRLQTCQESKSKHRKDTSCSFLLKEEFLSIPDNEKEFGEFNGASTQNKANLSSLLNEEFLCMPDNPQQLHKFNKPLEKHYYFNEINGCLSQCEISISRESLLKTIDQARRSSIARSA